MYYFVMYLSIPALVVLTGSTISGLLLDGSFTCSNIPQQPYEQKSSAGINTHYLENGQLYDLINNIFLLQITF